MNYLRYSKAHELLFKIKTASLCEDIQATPDNPINGNVKETQKNLRVAHEIFLIVPLLSINIFITQHDP